MLADIDLVDDSVLQLLGYWDKNGSLHYVGTSHQPSRTEILKFVAKF